MREHVVDPTKLILCIICQRGGGGRKSLKILTVELTVMFQRVLTVFLLKLGLK